MQRIYANYWWVTVLRGLLAVLFGILALSQPDAAATALVVIFGAYALVDGILALLAAFRGRAGSRGWWLLMIEGVLGIVAGILAFTFLLATALAIVYIIGIWAILTGIFEIMGALQLRRQVSREWLLMLGGILSILAGIAMLVWPVTAMVALIWLIGFYAILFGIVLVALGMRARSFATA